MAISQKRSVDVKNLGKLTAIIFGSYAAIFGHFLDVRGVTFCDIFAQKCPWDWFTLGKKKNCMYIKMSMYNVHATFVNYIFRNFAQTDDIKSFFCSVGTSLMEWNRV